MALSRLSNPQDTVTAITAALWTSEFDNIYNNALSLISPLTGNLDLNGFKLPNLAAGTAGSPSIPFNGDADTGLFRVGADEAGIAAAGAASMTFTNPASAVNYLKWSGSATGNAVAGTATGTDANISLNFVPKGTGTIQANAIEIVTISGTQTLTDKTLGANSIVPIGRYQRVEASGSNAANVTVTAAFTQIATANCGTVVAGDRLLVWAHAQLDKGATAGASRIQISKSAGTSVVSFEKDDSSGGKQSDTTGNASTSWTCSGSTICNVTVGGTLTLQLEGLSAGSNSTVLVALGQIKAFGLIG